MILIFSVIAGVICLDQLTKWLTVSLLAYRETVPLWEGVFHFTYERNTGMAFGMLKDHRWVFMVLSTVAIVGLLFYLIRYRPQNRWLQVSLSMIVGGGIGNMIDRIYLGYVVDFLDFRLINFAVFNVADSFVCVGAGIVIVYLLLDLYKEVKKEKQAIGAQDANEEQSDE